MSTWDDILAPMETAVRELLARTNEVESSDETSDAPLTGAVPLLDEVLAPTTELLAAAEEQVGAANLHLDDALASMKAWRERPAELKRRLTTPTPNIPVLLLCGMQKRPGEPAA